MSIPSDNPILLARNLGSTETDPAVSLAIGDGEIVALTRSGVPTDSAATTALALAALSEVSDVSGLAGATGAVGAVGAVSEVGLSGVCGGSADAGDSGSSDGDGDGAGIEVADVESNTATSTAESQGTTALLRCLAGADASATGELWIKGVAVHTLRPAARVRFSHAQCAVLPRTSRLLPELNMVDNAALPLLLAGVDRAEARRRAVLWLDRLEVGDHARAKIPELPLAVVRRVSIARALLTDPTIFLADEPLLGLDTADRFHLLRILRAASGSHGLTIVIATDDSTIIDWADRSIAVASGAVRHTAGSRP